MIQSLREEDVQREQLQRNYFGALVPVSETYDKQARALKKSLQKNRERLLKKEEVSLHVSNDLIASIYGFANWQTLQGLINDFDNENNSKLVAFIKHIYVFFLEEFKNNLSFSDEEYFSINESVISGFEAICKKIDKLNHILSGNRIIDGDVIKLIITFVRYFCCIYCSIYNRKIEKFKRELWESDDLENLNRFDSWRIDSASLEELQFAFEKMECKYPIIYLIHSTLILEKVNQSNIQVKKIINILAFCIKKICRQHLGLNKNKSLMNSLAFESLDTEKIAKLFFLNWV